MEKNAIETGNIHHPVFNINVLNLGDDCNGLFSTGRVLGDVMNDHNARSISILNMYLAM